MDTTTPKESEMTLSDGRTINVEAGNGEHAIVMVQTDASQSVICYMTGTVEQAKAEASRIAKGIEADLRWMNR